MASREKKIVSNKQLSPRKEATIEPKSSDELIDLEKEEDVKFLEMKKPRISSPAVKLNRNRPSPGDVGIQKDVKQIKTDASDEHLPVKEGTETPNVVVLVKKKRVRIRRMGDIANNSKLKQQRKKLVREDEDETVSVDSVASNPSITVYPNDQITLTKCLEPPVVLLTDGSSEAESPDKGEKPSNNASVHHKPRPRRRLKPVSPAGARDGRNGSRHKVHARPYSTRSAGTLPQLLRNGKRRKFKEPIGFDSTLVPEKKRRCRLTSSATDVSTVDSLNSSLVDGDSKMKIGSESDSSFLDSSHLDNGDWDSDVDFKPVLIGSNNTSSPLDSSGELTGDTLNFVSETTKKFNTSPTNDTGNDIKQGLGAKKLDGLQKMDSNSNLCQVSKVAEGSSSSKLDITSTKSKPKSKEIQQSVTVTKLKTNSEQGVSPEPVPSAPSADLQYLSKKQLEVASLAGEGSSNPPVDRSSTPDMKENWETISVNSTPSSKNFDASLDDISEKDFSTDCENVKDVRRSQRSSIRKTRAALLRLATSGKRGGKSSEKVDPDTLDDGEVAETAEEKTEELVDVESPSEQTAVEVIERLAKPVEDVASKIESETKSPVSHPPVLPVKIPKLASKLEVPRNQGANSSLGSNSKSDTDLQILRNSDLRRKRVKSLSTQDIVSLVDRGLFPSKERRASDLGRIGPRSKPLSGDLTKFTLPDSKHTIRFKVRSNKLRPFPRLLKEPSTENGATIDKAQEDLKADKAEACSETSEAVGDAAVPTSPDKDPPTDATPTLAADEVNIGLVQSLNMDEEIKLLEAKLRNEVESKEAKDSSESGPAVLSMGDIGNHDMAEKLREISMNFEDDSDIFPSLNIKKGSDLRDDVDPIDETPEQLAIKESIFQALGLQSLEAARLAKLATKQRVRHDPSYTGTLKTIIKLQRSPEKRTRPSKMKLYSDKGGKSNKEQKMNGTGIQYSICKDAGPSTEDAGCSTSSGVGNRKCLKPPITYRSYFDITCNPQLFEDQTQPDKVQEDEEVGAKDGEKVVVKQNLVIPEKASSFSIHPGRLCSDVCSYCFGKFGSLDTPCHIAQLKGSDRQVKILQAELHLTAESCLCDACYRHVDRKANCPSYREKHRIKTKRLHHMARQARPKATCCVQGCQQSAQHHVRRKWLTKLKRSIGKKVPAIVSSKLQLHQHTPLPLCSQHFSWIDHFMVCGLCRRRLNCNQMYLLGPEVHEINAHLVVDRIPVRLTEKLFLCKLCRYFTSLRIKFTDKAKLSGSNKMFYDSYRKKILHSLDVEVTDEPEEVEAPKTKKRRLKAIAKSEPTESSGGAGASTSGVPVINLTSGRDSPPSMDISDMVETQLVEPMVDYSTLQESPFVRPNSNARPTKIRLKVGPSDERPGDPRSFPDFSGTPELNVRAQFDFDRSVIVRSDSEGEWERCLMTLQYDKDSKVAFEKLKQPYGSQSSFFKHMLLLEQYWRSGELVPAPKSNPRTKSYLKSVRARINNFSKSINPPYQPAVFVPTAPKALPPPPPPAPSVPIIDLPMRRRMSGGVMTTAAPSPTPPAGSSSVLTPSSILATSSGSILAPGASSNPLFVSHVPPKKFVMNPATGEMVATKRKPNIVQITKGGQPLFRLVDPTKSQLRALQGYKHCVSSSPSTATSDPAEILPMICDVRSLGAEATNMWNVKTPPPLASPAPSGGQKLHISIVPKEAAAGSRPAMGAKLTPVSRPTMGPKPTSGNRPTLGLKPTTGLKVSTGPKPSTTVLKPNTVVTPTGIVLSKKLDVSVVPIPRQDGPSKLSDVL